MDKTSVNNLLDLVNQIHLKYDEISRVTGRNFNMFDILGLSSAEVRLHSNIIAQLLNPNGTHGQGSLYLGMFLKMLNSKIAVINNSNDGPKIEASKLDIGTGKVYVEEYIGKQTEQEGGRIDIICQDRNNNKIIIENKIHAPDQRNQLLRYYNYDINATLIYLTLFGEPPSQGSLGEKSVADLKLVLLSYETDITEWLEQCLKESYQLPVIRETIFQYLNSIKKLTNQIEIREMDNEIVNLITADRQKIASAIVIEKSVKDAKKLLLKRFGEKLYSLLLAKYESKTKIEIKESFGARYAGINVYPIGNDRAFFMISFLSDYRDFYLEIFNWDNLENGVVKKNKNELNLNFYKEQLQSSCNSLGKIENVRSAWQGDWVCRYTTLDKYFSDDNGWGDLADKNYEFVNKVANDISPIIDAMLDRVNDKTV